MHFGRHAYVPRRRDADARSSSLDMRTVRDLAALDGVTPDVLSMIFEDFISDGERRLIALEGAAATDLELVRFEAHTLKGASGAVGAREVMHLSDIIEHAAMDGAWSEETSEQLRVALANAGTQLRAFVAKLKA